MKATAALGVLILLLLAPPAVSQIPDDKLIVPGVRIGKWTLKMTINDLLRMNGQRVGGGGGAAIEQANARDFVSSDFGGITGTTSTLTRSPWGVIAKEP